MRRLFTSLIAAGALLALAALLALTSAPVFAHGDKAHDGLAGGTHREGIIPTPGTEKPIALGKLFGGPFELVDQNGHTRTDKDFLGRFMLVYFGYTDCPSICPLNLNAIAVALQILDPEDAARIQPVFVTVDAKKDTPERVKAFVANFDPRFIGLTGSPRQVAAAVKAYRIHRRKITEDGEDPGNYLVDHSSITHLIGPDGNHLTLFPHNTPGETMAERLKTYLARDRKTTSHDGT